MLKLSQLAYLSTVAFSGVSVGAQMVILPWLGVAVLGLSASELGILQAAKLMPLLLFLLIGGAISDHKDNRVWLSNLYCLLLLPQVFLAWLVADDFLNLFFLCVYGFSLGAILAFVQPARERMLPAIAGDSGGERIQRWVIAITGLQFSAQIAGFLLAGQMENWNLVYILLGQGFFFAFCGVFIRFTPKGECDRQRPSMAKSIKAGIDIVRQQPVLKQLILLVIFNGSVSMGLYSVVMPILVHRSLGESANFYAYIQLGFAAGTVAVTLFLLLRKKKVLQPGRLVALGLFGSGLLMISIATGLSTERLLIQVLIWGVLSGISMVMGRSIMQELSGDEHRARTMSIYQLALFGSAPFGAFVSGYLVDTFGVLALLRGAGWVTLGVFAMTLFAHSLWQFESSTNQDSGSSSLR